MLYEILHEHTSKKKYPDFIFTHLDDPVIGNVQEKFFTSEQEKRERLIKEGNPFAKWQETHLPPHDPANPAPIKTLKGFGNRQTMLFLNKFLFGNAKSLTSSSFYYILHNWNIGDISFSIKEIFNMFGYGDIYNEFKDELESLMEEYNNLTNYGELLQIAVPKKIVDKCVYRTVSGGPKQPLYVPEVGETTDIKVILAAQDKNPTDILEYVLLNTKDQYGAENPASGIKKIAYNPVDPEKMATFSKRFDNVTNRIKKSLQEKDKKQKQTAIERE